MIIGVPAETKKDEYRVGLLPVGAELLVGDGHQVLMQATAGVGSGIMDEEYAVCGAEIVDSVAEIYARADMIIKVKEPQPAELAAIRPGQIWFTYFHFAANAKMSAAFMASGAVAVAYETITDSASLLPLLTPMSEVAGKMSVQEGAKYLERPQLGRGVLLGGVPGVAPANVLVLGGGVVGTNAAKVAAGLGASVAICDISLQRLRYLSDVMPANVRTVFSDPHTIRELCQQADLVVGAVLIPGARAPMLIRREDLATMQKGAVIVDVAVDQGGCVQTTHPTTHSDPTYIIDDVVHYAVANMPGAVGRTSTYALCNATLPYARRIARLGYLEAARRDPGVAAGINMAGGKVTHRPVAESLGLPYSPLML
ncbi:MAG: Alanine dehydrogenase [Phycisphaerae bacterium]|nr:Alanine dehydrogenase [Phycisphaerae bacterium]